VNTQQIARVLGRRGGQSRARRLTADERRRIASLGGHARRQSLEAAQRVIANLNYLEMVLELQGGYPAITTMKTFTGTLPGIYARSLTLAAPRRRRAPA
jgi:hypothetical protein